MDNAIMTSASGSQSLVFSFMEPRCNTIGVLGVVTFHWQCPPTLKCHVLYHFSVVFN